MTTTYEAIRNEICRESQIGDTAAISQIDHPVAVEQNPDRVSAFCFAFEKFPDKCFGQDNFSLLHIAARKNRVAVIEALCNAGADVEAISRSGVTPLWLACHWRNRDAVYKLVTAGANPYFEPKAVRHIYS